MTKQEIVKLVEKVSGKSIEKLSIELKRKGGYLEFKEEGFQLFYNTNPNYANGSLNGPGIGLIFQAKLYTGLSGFNRGINLSK